MAVTETGSLYSTKVAFVYVFNLIVGVGALTLPKAFANAGWLMSIVLLCVLGFMSFVTATFMLEAMAAANGTLRYVTRQKQLNVNCDHELTDADVEPAVIEHTPLIAENQSEENGVDLYEITTRVEMGQMAKMFFSKNGVRLFYLCVVLYLYGDLAIYAAAVPKSLMQVACGSLNKSNQTGSSACFGSVSETNVYRIFLAAFALTLGPFAFFNVQKTKYLQMLTTFMRWLAFIMMIVLAFVRIGTKKARTDTKAVEFAQVPNLFGVCVYSFMCQHSLPSLVTPMKSKNRLLGLFVVDFSVVMLFYTLLSVTAIFAFRTEDLQDLYTLNFFGTSVQFVSYFLALFPVFTLSTNFPIISITLRDNLKNLFVREGKPFPVLVDRIVFPLATITPPIGIAFVTNNLEFLVGVTGSYAGTGVQYVIPLALMYYGRKHLTTLTGYYDNKHQSPFHRLPWLIFVLVWSLVCICFVTANHIINRN